MATSEAAVRVVGVVGAGVMGVGVAQSLAQTGHRVVLLDLSDEVLARARAEIEKNVRFHGMFTKTKGGPSAAEVLEKIHFTTDYAPFAGADFVIENVTEKWEIKSPIYPVLDEVCPPRACFAANTSAYSITRIGSLTRRPGKVLMLTINEAVWLIQDGVAPVEDVDRIFKTCFGHRMGPLETADLIGLDTVLYSIEVLYESYNDTKYRPCPLLKKMVDAGLHGRKNGRGFYDYAVAAPS